MLKHSRLAGLLLLTASSVLGSSWQEIKENETLIKEHKTFLTNRNFTADADKTAAGALIYAFKNSEAYILLGLRKDTKQYCNLGGKSKDNQKILAETAAQEIKEESIEIYAPHPLLLSQRPYVDVLTDKLLYRMYFYNAPFVESDYINARLQETKDFASQEYHHFLWVSAQELYQALIKFQQSFVISSQIINLYEPFYHSLQTPSALQYLQHLVGPNKKRRPFSIDSRLYAVPYAKPLQRSYKVFTHWPLPQSGTPLMRRHERLPFGQNIYGQDTTTYYKAWARKDETLFYKKAISIDPEKERHIFSHAVVAHQAAMLEIKQRFMPPRTLSEEWPYDYTVADLHLIKCNPAFYTAYENFHKTKDIEKLKEDLKSCFLSLFESRRYSPFQNQKESLAARAAEVTAHTHLHKEWPVFFHATSSSVGHLFHTFTHLHQMLSLDLMPNFYAMRGTHLYFKGIQPFKKEETFYDSSLLLYMNAALLGGWENSTSSTSSLSLWEGDYSMQEPKFTKKFEEATYLLGISTADYGPLKALQHQYTCQQSSDHKNGMLYTLHVHPALFQEKCFVSCHYNGLTSFSDLYTQYLEKSKVFSSEKLDSLSYLKPSLFPEVCLLLHPSIRPNVYMKAFPFYPLNSHDEKAFQNHMRHIFIAMLGQWLAQNTAIMPDTFLEPVKLQEVYKLIYESEIGHLPPASITAKGLNILLEHGKEEMVMRFLKESFSVKLLKEVYQHALLLSKEDFIDDLKSKFSQQKNIDFARFFNEAEILILLQDLKQKKSLNTFIQHLDFSLYGTTTHNTFLWKCFKHHKDKAIDKFFEIFPTKSLDDYFKPAKQYQLYALLPHSVVQYTKDLNSFPLSACKVWLEQGMIKSYPNPALTRLADHIDRYSSSNELSAVDIMFNSLLNQTLNFSVSNCHYDFNSKLSSQEFLLRLVNFMNAHKISSSLLLELHRCSDYLGNLLNPEKIDLTAINPATKEPFIFSFVKVFKEGFYLKCNKFLYNCHTRSVQKGSPSPFEVTNLQGDTIIHSLQKRYMAKFKIHWLLKIFDQPYYEPLKKSLYHPSYIKAFGVSHTLNEGSIRFLEAKNWLTAWITMVNSDATSQALQTHLNNMPTAQCFHMVKQAPLEQEVKPYLGFKNAKDKTENFFEVRLEENVDRIPKLIQELQSAQANKSEIIQTLHEPRFQVYPYMFTSLAKDIHVNIIDYFIGKPLKLKKVYQEAFSHQQFKMARYLFNKVSDKLSLIIGDSSQYCGIYFHPYIEKIKRDFPEIYYYHDQYFSFFRHEIAYLFNSYVNSYLESETYLKENISHLKNLNPGTGTPYLKDLLFQKAVWEDKMWGFIQRFFKDYPELITQIFPDGTSLFDHLENLNRLSMVSHSKKEKQLKRMRDMRHFVTEYYQTTRKKARLASVL